MEVGDWVKVICADSCFNGKVGYISYVNASRIDSIEAVLKRR